MTQKDFEHIEEIITGLGELSYNLWWTWNPKAQDIFSVLSERKWRSSKHSAVAVLNSVSHDELRARLYEQNFRQDVINVLKEFNDYLSKPDTWCAIHAPELKGKCVAYFSAEFGFHESFPIYSGGLGVLAGDHTKSASDLGIPFVGISLFYRSGYFQQSISPDGWQFEHYPVVDPEQLPVTLVTDEENNPVKVSVEIGHNVISMQAYKLLVGRAVLYLLDTNLPENDMHFREISSRVYGGDTTNRIMQEIVLGIGGVRFLRALGLAPDVFHLNEGHNAFLALELLREQLLLGKSKADAEATVRNLCVFTTHTPVAAGHDRFSAELVRFMFDGWCQTLKETPESILPYGRQNPENENEEFCMTILALKMSRAANGVSELHGRVSREMWKGLFRVTDPDKVPIGHITNGVHILGWVAKRTRIFWHRHLGEKWLYYIKNKAIWEQVADPDLVPDSDLWALRYGLRRDLIEYVRRIIRTQYQHAGIDFAPVQDSILSPDVLTIGFARRFATYKRAPLVFRDMDRLTNIIRNIDRPVQLLFAGKAHPNDDEGKRFIQQIYAHTKSPALVGKVIFLENYDINVARHMISGVDVWLNTPRRPYEASGTSGMKILIHGGLNLSIMDGWWREGFNGVNGWAIGGDSSADDWEKQDEIDAGNLYEILENQLVPEFYDRDDQGIPRRWIGRIRKSMETLIPVFNTDRMVTEYVKKYYIK
jgi:glycogen phosphorylase